MVSPCGQLDPRNLPFVQNTESCADNDLVYFSDPSLRQNTKPHD
jgi:hypothetical protein